MIRPNWICRPYRGVSVQRLGVPLTEAAVTEHLVGRRVYRRTEVLIAEGDEGHAVVTVAKEPDGDSETLFRPVTEVRWIAGPEATAFVRDPDTDTGNATQMARAAAASGLAAQVYVVEGRNQHVNLIVEPAPVPIRIVEVVPPHPPKLLEMAQRVLEYDEDLDPVVLELVPVDLNAIAAGEAVEHWLLPCRSGGLDIAGHVDFLDSGPPDPAPWTLLGCERSRQIHRELYGAEPTARVEMCPRVRAGTPAVPTLLKCCLRERGIETDGETVVVPWGATLEEVRAALHRLVPAWAPEAVGRIGTG